MEHHRGRKREKDGQQQPSELLAGLQPPGGQCVHLARPARHADGRTEHGDRGGVQRVGRGAECR
jgi:hypothetical protein